MRRSIRASRWPDDERCIVARSSSAKARCAARSTASPTNRAALVGLVILVPMLVAILTYPLWLALHAQRHRPAGDEHRAVGHALVRHRRRRPRRARPPAQGGRISLLVAVSSVAISTVDRLSRRRGRRLRRPLGRRHRHAPRRSRHDPAAGDLPAGARLDHRHRHLADRSLVISLLSWPVLSRMVRARLLELRERDFVVAARGMGAGCGTCSSATACRTASTSSSSTRRCRSPTRSCSRPASPSSASACRRPTRAGATC